MKLKVMRWSKCVARLEELRNRYEFESKDLKERNHLSGEFIGQLNYSQLLKKDATPWS
jgi:hypothetical protein